MHSCTHITGIGIHCLLCICVLISQEWEYIAYYAFVYSYHRNWNTLLIMHLCTHITGIGIHCLLCICVLISQEWEYIAYYAFVFSYHRNWNTLLIMHLCTHITGIGIHCLLCICVLISQEWEYIAYYAFVFSYHRNWNTWLIMHSKLHYELTIQTWKSPLQILFIAFKIKCQQYHNIYTLNICIVFTNEFHLVIQYKMVKM